MRDLSKYKRLPCDVLAYSILLEEKELTTGELLEKLNDFCVENGWKPFAYRSLVLALTSLEREGILKRRKLHQGFYGYTSIWKIAKRRRFKVKLIPKSPKKKKQPITMAFIARVLGISPKTIESNVKLLRSILEHGS